jgi:hypothetical protein
LDAANHVIEHNLSRKGKKLWTDAEAGEKIRLTSFHGFGKSGFATHGKLKNCIKTARHLWRYRRIVPHQCTIPYFETVFCAEASLSNRRRHAVLTTVWK